MSGYLLDTHIWVWYVSGSPRIPRGLVREIDAAIDRCWLSPVSVWELGMLSARGRVELAGGFREWARDALRRVPLADAGLTREVAAAASEIALPHGDPIDRILAATALEMDLTLLTVDRRMTRARWLPTRSR